jgi:4-carboxymuconolactone decarboxylase
VPHSEDRFERGQRVLTELGATEVLAVAQSLGDIAPDLGAFMVEFGFGDVYSRPGLDAQSRQLVTIGALAAQGGCEPQLAVHIGLALEVGLTPEAVIEALIQTAVFCGFPRALNAIAVARTVFAGRGLAVNTNQTKRAKP